MKDSEILYPWWIVIKYPAANYLALARLFEHAQRFRDFSGWRSPRWLRRFLHSSSPCNDSRKKLFRDVSDELKVLGLDASADQADRICSRLENESEFEFTWSEYAESTKALYERIEDETNRRNFFTLSPTKVSYYENAATLFGEQVNKSFPSAQSDIEHAAKCYAYGQNTAAVFHFMRVMEFGLRSLGKSLNNPALDAKKNPSWESILEKCDKELKRPLADRSAEWRANDVFFSAATANLRSVKDAWRNPTMHVERDYDDEQALSVINAVKGFMQHLAGKLCE
jgi:hypothetical protein